MSNHSNRSRGSSGKRAKRTLLGGSSIELVSGMRDPSKAIVIVKGKQRGSTKLLSSVPGSWSDSYHHKPATFASYHFDTWSRINAVRTRINPNRETTNKQRLLVWSSKLQRPVRRALQIPGTEVGSVYQAPADQLVMRGDECLFDQCIITPSLPNTRKHKPCGSLPPFRVLPIVKPGKAALDAAVIDWRHAQVQAYYDALIKWRT